LPKGLFHFFHMNRGGAHLLIELHYLPGVAWFAVAAGFGRVVVEAREHYVKGSFRNRCHIAGSHGLQRLSVPLVRGKNAGMPIRRVRVAYQQPWMRAHWHSIQSAYGRTPFFEHYAPRLEAHFQRPPEFLFDWNLALLHTLLDCLELELEIETSRHWFPLGETPDHLVDFRNRIHPKRPDPRLQTALQRHPYPQPFLERHGFLPGLSVLDLLFSQGPAAPLILQAVWGSWQEGGQ